MSIISAGNTTTTAIVVTGDTTGNLVFTTGGANTVALTIDSTQNITTTQKFAAASMPTGSVLQVVQGIKTDTFSTTAGMGTPAEITGLSAAIAPKFSTSKILVTVVIGEIGASAGSTYNLILYRGSTAICLGDAAGNRIRSSSAGGINTTGVTWVGQGASFTFLDSPATTNSTTYTVKIGGNTTSTMTVNYDYRNTDVANDSARVPSTITLQEVAV